MSVDPVKVAAVLLVGSALALWREWECRAVALPDRVVETAMVAAGRTIRVRLSGTAGRGELAEDVTADGSGRVALRRGSPVTYLAETNPGVGPVMHYGLRLVRVERAGGGSEPGSPVVSETLRFVARRRAPHAAFEESQAIAWPAEGVVTFTLQQAVLVH